MPARRCGPLHKSLSGQVSSGLQSSSLSALGSAHTLVLGGYTLDVFITLTEGNIAQGYIEPRMCFEMGVGQVASMNGLEYLLPKGANGCCCFTGLRNQRKYCGMEVTARADPSVCLSVPTSLLEEWDRISHFLGS